MLRFPLLHDTTCIFSHALRASETRLRANTHTRSTLRTASGKSSGVGGDSEDESRLDRGGPWVAAAGGNGDGLAAGDAASSDPAAPSAGASVVRGHSTRPAAVHGAERERGGGGGRDRGGRGTVEEWSFEKLAGTPMLADAFEAFAKKALCHESVLFLIEVSR